MGQSGQPTPFAPLVTAPMAEQWHLRTHLQPYVDRLALCYWWPTHNLADARTEARMTAMRIMGWDEPLRGERRAFVHGALDDAIEAAGAVHDESYETLRLLACHRIEEGDDRAAVRCAVKRDAMLRTPLPPPWLFQAAIDRAVLDAAIKDRFWLRRAAARVPAVRVPA